MPELEYNEKDVLTRASQGDRDAFGELYARYIDRIFNYVYYRTGNTHDAEDLTADERRERFQQMMEERRKEAERRAQEIEKQIAGILDTSQFNRLKQLARQREGIDALLAPEVVQVLGLTEDQQSAIQRQGGTGQ